MPSLLLRCKSRLLLVAQKPPLLRRCQSRLLLTVRKPPLPRRRRRAPSPARPQAPRRGAPLLRCRAPLQTRLQAAREPPGLLRSHLALHHEHLARPRSLQRRQVRMK